MFFLKILDDQDQELELMQDATLSDPAKTSVANVGGGPGRDHGRRTARRSSTTTSFPTLKELPRRTASAPPACRSGRLRGRVQLHEVRPAAAAGRQQDQ